MRFLFVFALFCATFAPAWAQTPLPLPVRDVHVLRGKRVPLPPGEWTVLAQGFGRVEGDWPGAYGAIEAVLLAQVRDKRVEGLALLQSNVRGVDAGWGVPAACESAVYVTAIRTSARNIACAYAEMLPTDSPALSRLPAWREGMAEAKRRGLSLPEGLAFAVARAGDRQDVVEARYAFAPSAFGLGAASVEIPAESGLAGWTRDLEARLESALLNPGAPVPALPAPSATSAAEAQSGEMPAWKLGLYKLATNRITQTAISFGIGMALTANAYTSTSLALLQSITHSMVYYGNEVIWEWPTPPRKMEFVAERRS